MKFVRFMSVVALVCATILAIAMIELTPINCIGLVIAILLSGIYSGMSVYKLVEVPK